MGFEGIKAAFNRILDTLKKGDGYHVFTLGEELKLKETIRFFKNYHVKRRQKGVKIKLISDIKLKDFILKYHKHPEMRFRFSKSSLPTGIFIFKDHVMTVIWRDTPTAFVIHSKQNYNYYKNFFLEL